MLDLSDDEDEAQRLSRRLSGVFEKNELLGDAGVDPRDDKLRRLEKDNQHLREIIRMYEDMTLQQLEGNSPYDAGGVSGTSSFRQVPTAENLSVHDENMSLKTALKEEKARRFLLKDEREELKTDLRRASDLLEKLTKRFVEPAKQNGKDSKQPPVVMGLGDLSTIGEEAARLTWSNAIPKEFSYVALSENETVASYLGKDKLKDFRCYAVTDAPLDYREHAGGGAVYFEVRIEKISDTQDPVGLAIGVTTTPPTKFPSELPGTADEIDGMWLVGYDGDMWDGANKEWKAADWSGAHLVKGDRVGVRVDGHGHLHVFANGAQVLQGPCGIPIKDKELYGVIDLLGRTDSVKLMPKLGPRHQTLEVG